ncbi:cytochrome c3 family protein [Bacteroidota bacterium]
MKKIKFIFALFLTFAISQKCFDQIATTSHDFSGSDWGSTEICIFCHTPHNADVTVTDAPLWNHLVTTETFTEYSSASLDATVGAPTGISKLCLSCHDGATNVDAFGGGAGISTISAAGDLDVDLTDDHPISFTYDATLASNDGELENPTTANSGLGGTITADMLFGGQMECASCHDAHDNTNGSFLIMSNAASALCLTCHIK